MDYSKRIQKLYAEFKIKLKEDLGLKSIQKALDKGFVSCFVINQMTKKGYITKDAVASLAEVCSIYDYAEGDDLLNELAYIACRTDETNVRFEQESIVVEMAKRHKKEEKTKKVDTSMKYGIIYI